MVSRGVSVVIPVHNGMPFLPQTLNSVRNQSQSVDQILVMENASTDGTLDFLSSQADIELKIQPKLVSPAQNWSDAIRAARYEFVKILCADDLLEHDCIERQSAVLRHFQDCSITAGRRRVILESGRELVKAHGMKGLVGLLPRNEAIKTIGLRGQNPFGEVSAILFRTSNIQSHLPWPDEYGYATDIAMYLRLLKESDIFCDPNVVCSFRLGRSSWSYRSQKEQARDLILLLDEAREAGIMTTSRFGKWKGLTLAKLRQVQRMCLYIFIGLLEKQKS